MARQGYVESTLEKPDATLTDETVWRVIENGVSKKATGAALAAFILAGAGGFDVAGSAAAAEAAAATYTDNKVAALVASSPAALDTLNELAAALGNDSSFATTVTNALAGKQASSANLTSWAALAPSAKQDASANLDAWSGLAPSAKQDASANLSSWSALATSAKQDAHANLTTIAGLASLTPLTRLAASGETVTASNPIWDLAQTWNNGAVTFTGLRFNATGTAAVGSALLDLQFASSSMFIVQKNGAIYAAGNIKTTGNGTALWAGSDAGGLGIGASLDTILARDAANTLAQRNGTTAQAFRVYNTYTDASNYERGEIKWTSNVFRIGSASAGTGTVRDTALDSASNTILATQGTNRWYVSAASGYFLAATDNTYDIGASGANRPRNIYVGTDGNFNGKVFAQNGTQVSAAASFYWTGRSVISSPADSVITLTNAAATDFARLQFGGTTSSFPAIKRNAAAFDFRLADDSAYAAIAAKALTLTGGSIAASAPVLDLTQTWNDAASGTVTFTGIKFNVTDTLSAAASLLMDLQNAGVSKFSVNKNGSVTSVQVFNSAIAFRGNADTAFFSLGASNDTILARDAAYAFAQRNGTNAQTFRVYNTYTDASNYERGAFDWSTNAGQLSIGTQAAGTGTSKNVVFMRNSTTIMSFANTRVTACTDLNFITDNTYDIGTGATFRPRDINFARQLVAPAGTTTKAPINMASGVAPTSPADGDIWFDGSALKIRIGGVTKTFTLT